MAQIETYIPLYRKYRPQSFADLMGQVAISQTLSNAIKLNKVAHAYLFCGPRGTGKTSAARIFAKSLNCEQGPTVTPCQECASCTGITRGNALDVIEFDAASNNSVDNARELIENCQFAPISGRFKIYIIDEVHMLTTSAFNALLKTLEEPPPNVVFIFATTEAHKVLPTIISRCQRFDFNRITVEDIIERLHQIAGAESITIEPDALQIIARHARGGLRDAVGLLDQIAVIGRTQPEGRLIRRHDVVQFIGALEEDLLIAIAQSMAGRDAPALMETLTRLNQRGIEPGQLVKELTQHFRNLFILKASGSAVDPNALSLPADYVEKLSIQANDFTLEELPQILSRLAAIERNIRHTQHPLLWLEIGLLEIAYRQDIYLVQELAERVTQLESLLASGKREIFSQLLDDSSKKEFTSPGKQSHVPPKPLVSSEDSIRQADPSDWQQICALISSPTTKSLAKEHTFLMDLDQTQSRLQVGCTSEPTLNLLKKPEKFIHLQKAVDQFFARPMQINLCLQKAAAASFSQAVPYTIINVPEEPSMGTLETPQATSAPAASKQSQPVPSAETPLDSPELAEAKQYALQLLQGKIIDTRAPGT